MIIALVVCNRRFNTFITHYFRGLEWYKNKKSSNKSYLLELLSINNTAVLTPTEVFWKNNNNANYDRCKLKSHTSN